MKCLIRFTQTHETFRLAEIQALAELENIPLQVEHYVSNVSEIYGSNLIIAVNSK